MSAEANIHEHVFARQHLSTGRIDVVAPDLAAEDIAPRSTHAAAVKQEAQELIASEHPLHGMGHLKGLLVHHLDIRAISQIQMLLNTLAIKELDSIGQQFIVGIQVGNEVGPCRLNATAARLGKPSILLMDNPHASILLSQSIGNVTGLVGRPVIDYHDFNITVGLRQSACHTARQEMGGIIGGDDDGN